MSGWVDLLILLALLALALGVGRRMLAAVPFATLLEESLFAIGLGLGLLAYATLALGVAGLLDWRALVVLFGTAAWYARRSLPAAFATAARGLRRWLAQPRGRVERLAFALGALLVAAEVILLLAPPVGGDQTKYQLVYPRLYAEAHRIVDTPWTFWGHVQYLVNMLFAAAFALRGDVLARLVNASFGVLTALAIFAAGRRWFTRRVGVWAALLFLSMPLTVTLMTRAWVDLGLTFYVLLAVIGTLGWLETGAVAWLVVAALMAGFAGGTKMMGLLAPALLAVVVAWHAWRTARPTIAERLRVSVTAVVGFGLLAAVAASPCYLRNAVETGNPIYPFGYGVFGGRHWSAEAARGLDGYYSAYRERQAARRGGHAYDSVLAAVRFPWDATMAPHSFEEVGRSAYDLGPLLLAFVPGLWLLRRDPRARLVAAVAVAYAAVIVLGMWAHPRYIHPALALLLVVTVRIVDEIGGHVGRLVATSILGVTVLGQVVLAGRVLAPLWPDSARVVTGSLSADAFLRRHDARYPLWSLVNAEVPPDGNVLVLGMIPHPYHLERTFTLASPLEQNAIDYRRIATVEEFVTALEPFGVTHVVREREAPKAGANPIGDHVTRLWDDLLARCEKVKEGKEGTLYRLTPALARGEAPHARRAPRPRDDGLVLAGAHRGSAT